MSTDLDTALQDSLLQFCEPSSHCGNGGSLFLTHREIAIARYALNQQAEAYHRSVSLLQGLLENQQTPANPAEIPRVLSSIFSLIQAIEAKSQKLIESAQHVTALLGTAISIDVDKANLHNLLLSLPHLVRDTIQSLTDDSTLTSSIVESLTHKLNDAMTALRFSPQGTQSFSAQAPRGITLEEFSDMINSVPSQ